MELLDKKGLTTVWAAIKNTFTSKSDVDEKYAKKTEALLGIDIDYTEHDITINTYHVDNIDTGNTTIDSATSTYAGVMTAADKNKLDGISSGANNYKLPVASTNSMGGIKTSVDYDQYHCFPICTDTNGVAYTKIDSISLFNGSVKSYQATENMNYTIYGYNEINSKVGSGLITLRFPSKSGTLALKSDVSDLLKANITYDISKCKKGSINVFVNDSSKDLSLDSIKDKEGMIVFAYVVASCNITANINMILYNNVPNFTGKVGVTPGMYLIIPSVNNINIFSLGF